MEIEQEPKYKIENGKIVNRASGEMIPDDEPITIFRARDKHARSTLMHYFTRVKDNNHASAVLDRLQDFQKFRTDHPNRMKEPDTELAIDDNA